MSSLVVEGCPGLCKSPGLYQQEGTSGALSLLVFAFPFTVV